MEKRSNKGLVVVLVIFILISLGLGGYITYDKFFKKEEVKETKEVKNTNSNDDKETEELTIDSPIVKKLYSYVATDIWYDQDLITKVLDTKKEVLMTSMPDEIKAKFAYRRIAISDLHNDFCGKYPNTLKVEHYACGDEGKTDDYSKTKYVEEDKIEEMVNSIFGKNSYKKVKYFNIDPASAMMYDVNTKRYVLGTCDGGGTSETYNVKLTDVKQDKDTLSLIENVWFNYNEYDSKTEDLNQNISYNFKKADNGEYYLYSVSLAK